MTPQQQLRQLGISAEAHDGHIIIQTDRTFQMMTPIEIQKFSRNLKRAYIEAQLQARGRSYIPRPEVVTA